MKQSFMKAAGVLVVLVLMLSLVACSSKSSSSAGGKITLKVLDWNTTNKKETQKALVEAVKKKLPNVTLQFKKLIGTRISTLSCKQELLENSFRILS
ncbi:hypothetical protein J7E81_12635 [Bacillus sp. ISL-18]|uniref:hypothetical protein n=1 Tax=Bacillus sp. ISL-18 TaxID=2819118 RepID=UPI001BEAA07D|nr:hypothetical protein [Bacillus sp. ISL-18]MBT2656067.1 hypothetical protein [Bacillus sp. ISL-18]